MSAMSELAFEIQEAQDQAWEAAMELEAKLSKLSDYLWQDQDGADGPMFRAPADMLEMLKTMKASLARPIAEIEGTV